MRLSVTILLCIAVAAAMAASACVMPSGTKQPVTAAATPLPAATTLACPSGLSTCGGTCTNLSSDNKNCGVCGTSCPANAACSGGACSCTAGFASCGGSCIGILSDSKNCGACGNDCSDTTKYPLPGSHMSKSGCSKGECTYSCDEGYLDCDGVRSNGCEVNAKTDNKNCGACGRICSGDFTCDAGHCTKNYDSASGPGY